jgi:hypothetical protein
MKNILFLVVLFTILFYDCKNSNKQSIIKEPVKEVGEEIKPKRVFDTPQPSKVITYREIMDRRRYIEATTNTDYTLYYTKQDAINNMFSDLSDYFQYMLSAELRLLRNEFFAHKGYILKSEDFNEYFLKKEWYNPTYTSMDSIVLDKMEQQMIDSILLYERTNIKLTESILKGKMTQLLQTGEWESSSYGYLRIFPPIALFRRNIGYLIADKTNIEEFEIDMYRGNQELILIDTIGKKRNILVMGFIRQLTCPAEYCLYGGILFTCDINFNHVIDSKPFQFNDLYREQKNDSVLYLMKMPFDNEKIPFLVTPSGKIMDEI